MSKRLVAVASLAVAALALSGAATGSTHASKMSFAATLNAGQETPHPKGTKAGASGKFTATVSGTTLSWKLTFAHLTGAATAAHIHAAKKGVPGPVIVPLCGPCTSGQSGTATLSSAQIAQMKSGGTYVNVHTAKNGGGEIRGQIRMTM